MWSMSARPQAPANRTSRRSSSALDAAVFHRRSRAMLLVVSPTAGSGIPSWRFAMSEFWRQCEGQVIDNRFRLRHYLGGTEDSAVFLTQLAEPQSKKAAIKFIPSGPNADLQISLWRRIMQLVHPNLLRIYDIGRCRIENRDRLYVVMEYAEEDLSQIIPQRALTGSEAREMLGPVLDALVYLHSFGYVHSRIKPSNILATADQLKLSSDTLFPIGESRKLSRKFDAHDSPETATSPLSAAADVWSLGMTLVETLTQRPCALQPGNQADPIVPDTLPQPFLDVARHALRRDPRRRWTVAEIAARLNPVAAAAAAVQPAARPDSVEKPTRRETPPAPKPSAPAAVQNSLKAAAEKKPTAEPRSSAVITPTPTSATVRTGTFPSANAPSHSGSSSARAEVLEQVLPDASENALATIHGVVRVGVRVQVDPTGNVAEARLDSPGPSKYFAGLALKAARRWQFTSPEVGGHSVPSEWLIRFHFTPSGPKAIPTQTAP